MNNRIIQSARDAYRKHWRSTSDVSSATKQSTAVTKAWQDAVLLMGATRFQKEVQISNAADERIDLVDDADHIAYELKVSGKNPHHEFFKDIFKVITYNHNHDKKLLRLVFITEAAGINRLKKNGLTAAVIASSADFDIKIDLETI